MEYKKRITMMNSNLKMEAFGATLIVGPKGCGKTTSAKQKAKSFVEFQDEEQREICSPSLKLRHPNFLSGISLAFLMNGRMRRSCGVPSENL